MTEPEADPVPFTTLSTALIRAAGSRVKSATAAARSSGAAPVPSVVNVVTLEPMAGCPRLRAGDWLRDSGVNVRADETAADGRVKYVLDHCLFDDQHRGQDAAVIQDSAGRLSYHCSGDRCPSRDISDVADRIGGPASHHYDLLESEAYHRLLVDDWLGANGVAARKKLLADGRTAYFFTCPSQPPHGAAYIVQTANGRVQAECLNAKCPNRWFMAFTVPFGKPAPTHYDPPMCARPDPSVPVQVAVAPPHGAAYNPGFMSSAALAAGDFKLEWLVKNVLVRGQLAVVGGPPKSLKTNTCADLAISLGSGRPFLGAFEVARAVRVAILSGESNQAVLKETATRICAAKKIDLAAVDVLWGFRLPQLANARQLACLRDHLRDSEVAVLVIDPLYLCLLAGAGAEGLSASNLYQIGPLLQTVARVCQEIGVTPILVHHTKKTLSEPHRPLGLADLAFSGIAEFARQWLMLSRRETFALGTGLHRLWLSAGGSAGHSSAWAVDVDEGLVGADFSGRSWNVTVTNGVGLRPVKEDRRARRDAEDDTRVLAILSQNGPSGKGVGYTQIRTLASLSGEKLTRILARLVAKGVVEEFRLEGSTPGGGKRGRGLRLRSPGSPGQSSSVPVIPEADEPVSRTSGSSGSVT